MGEYSQLHDGRLLYFAQDFKLLPGLLNLWAYDRTAAANEQDPGKASVGPSAYTV